MDWRHDYGQYRKIFKGRRLPLAFVDLDRFDRNVAYVAATQEKTGKTIRVASKSIRSVDLIKRVFDKGGPAYKGILAFTMEEAAFLFDHGLDDIIVAYPTIQGSDLDLFVRATQQGADICLMADCFDHLSMISKAGQKAGVTLKICLDADMSFRPLGDRLHLGVRRSPLFTPAQVLDLAEKGADLPGIKLCALMGYEAKVAKAVDHLRPAPG